MKAVFSKSRLSTTTEPSARWISQLEDDGGSGSSASNPANASLPSFVMLVNEPIPSK